MNKKVAFVALMSVITITSLSAYDLSWVEEYSPLNEESSYFDTTPESAVRKKSKKRTYKYGSN